MNDYERSEAITELADQLSALSRLHSAGHIPYWRAAELYEQCAISLDAEGEHALAGLARHMAQRMADMGEGWPR